MGKTKGSSDEEKRRKKKKKHDKKKSKKDKKSKDLKVKNEDIVGPLPPPELLQKSKSMAPMTKEDYDKRQNVIKKVYDEESGRYRLIKGDGEIIEEIVSKDRHNEINKQATLGDGEYFQSVINKSIKK